MSSLTVSCTDCISDCLNTRTVQFDVQLVIKRQIRKAPKDKVSNFVNVIVSITAYVEKKGIKPQVTQCESASLELKTIELEISVEIRPLCLQISGVCG